MPQIDIYTKQQTDAMIASKPSKSTQQITVTTALGTVNCTGVTTTNTVIISPDPSSYDVYTTAGVYCSAQGSGTLTFTSAKTPTASMTVNVLILD